MEYFIWIPVLLFLLTSGAVFAMAELKKKSKDEE